MENDKLFNFMEKMYGEMQKGFKGVNERLDKVEQNQITFEHKVINKLDALFDGYTQNAEQLNELEAKVDFIAEKVSKNEMEIRVLQYSKSNRYRG